MSSIPVINRFIISGSIALSFGYVLLYRDGIDLHAIMLHDMNRFIPCLLLCCFMHEKGISEKPLFQRDGIDSGRERRLEYESIDMLVCDNIVSSMITGFRFLRCSTGMGLSPALSAH